MEVIVFDTIFQLRKKRINITHFSYGIYTKYRF
jgi:hypothetical protein